MSEEEHLANRQWSASEAIMDRLQPSVAELSEIDGLMLEAVMKEHWTDIDRWRYIARMDAAWMRKRVPEVVEVRQPDELRPRHILNKDNVFTHLEEQTDENWQVVNEACIEYASIIAHWQRDFVFDQ